LPEFLLGRFLSVALGRLEMEGVRLAGPRPGRPPTLERHEEGQEDQQQWAAHALPGSHHASLDTVMMRSPLRTPQGSYPEPRAPSGFLRSRCGSGSARVRIWCGEAAATVAASPLPARQTVLAHLAMEVGTVDPEPRGRLGDVPVGGLQRAPDSVH